MSENLVTVSYIGATILFILALGGLSSQESARKGNLYGIIGMAIAIVATVLGPDVTSFDVLGGAILLGAIIGIGIAIKIDMTQMPELVAILHSLVGLAAALVGFASFLEPDPSVIGAEKIIHEIEIYIGIFIGVVTFSGSVIAFGKLSGKIGGKPVMIPGRHFINLLMVLATVYFAYAFVQADGGEGSLNALIIMSVIAFIIGIHMVMAIGGADMPVVVSMLNSYSGWAAAATGFMLSNDLMIVTGALVGSSGAILSIIMCRAMNRSFISVIAGGFGEDDSSKSSSTVEYEGEVTEVSPQEVAEMMAEAKKVMIIPGYGMAVAQAQHTVNEITKILRNKGVEVIFGIHPVAGRMPGHMNILLAEAKVPYDIVFEMDEINDDFPNVDVSIIIGANDIVNPSALDDPDSPIAGMPVLEVWKGKNTVVLKRGMATGYAGVQNPLFFKENTHMLFGDAKSSVEGILRGLQE